MVGVDVDGVLADLLTPILEGINTTFSKSLTPEDMDSWCIKKHLEGDEHKFWDQLGNSNLHDRLLPYPGAKEGLALLQTVAEVYIVTSHLSAGRTWVYDRDQWLLKHFGIPKKRVIHTEAKYRVLADALVDDRPDNVIAWQAVHPTGRGVVWAHPWNADTKCKYRTNSWVELTSWVETLGSKHG